MGTWRIGLGMVVLLAVIGCPGSAGAITLQKLVLEGDGVGGVGTVTRIDNLAVNNEGHWLVEADTDNPDTDIDVVLLGPAGLAYQEGEALAEPPGASLNTFDAVNLNNAGNSGWNFFLSGTSGTSDDSGIYMNRELVLQEGTISGAAGFSPGTPYIGFFEGYPNDPVGADGVPAMQILVVASVDDPLIGSTVDRALVIFDVDADGNLLAETVIAKEGDFYPGIPDAIADFGTNPHQTAFNDSGQALYFVDLSGSTVTDGLIVLDHTVIAQEGTPSPVGGLLYNNLSGRGLDLNNGGHFVFKASLLTVAGDAAGDVIIGDNPMGARFRAGDTLPSISPYFLTGFGLNSGPVQIDDAGNILWYGEWDDPDATRNAGLFWNEELVVQEGVTMIDGMLVEAIASGQDAFQLSDNGAYAIFEADLAGGLNGAFLLTTPAASVAGGLPETGARLHLAAAPNPFSTGTVFRFTLASASEVMLRVFDARGRRVATVASGALEAGGHEIRWDGAASSGERVAPGVYYARLQSGSMESVERLVLVGD